MTATMTATMTAIVPVEVLWAAGAFAMLMAGFLAAAYSE